jgi:uncharacterized membrane protein
MTPVALPKEKISMTLADSLNVNGGTVLLILVVILILFAIIYFARRF